MTAPAVLNEATAPRWRLRDAVLFAPKILLTGLLILAIADMVFGVFMRYVVTAITDRLDVDPFNFFFVEEIGEYTLTWLTMVGAGIGIAERAHFTLHILTHRLPERAQRPIHVATHILIAGFGALALWYGVQLAIVNSALNSPALEINLAWVYIAPAVGGALIILYALAAAVAPPPASDADETGIAAAGDD
jgi:TRAP-type C4-dicarboxylate transport system permease small subunit